MTPHIEPKTSTPPLTDEALVPEAAAEWLGGSINWLKEQRLKGTGPAWTRLSPHRVRYMRSDLLAFCAANTVRPAVAA